MGRVIDWLAIHDLSDLSGDPLLQQKQGKTPNRPVHKPLTSLVRSAMYKTLYIVHTEDDRTVYSAHETGLVIPVFSGELSVCFPWKYLLFWQCKGDKYLQCRVLSISWSVWMFLCENNAVQRLEAQFTWFRVATSDVKSKHGKKCPVLIYLFYSADQTC